MSAAHTPFANHSSKKISKNTPSMALLATIGTAYGIQALCAAFAIPSQTEKYYDLSGSATFLSCTVRVWTFILWCNIGGSLLLIPILSFPAESKAVSLYYPALRHKLLVNPALPWPPLRNFHPRQLVMSALTCLWAARLGSFLFLRIKKNGSDSRFDQIKRDPVKFFGAWMAQASWVSLTAFPVYAVNSIPASRQPAWGWAGSVGTGLWAASFLVEVVADEQKSKWREEKVKKIHSEEFISRGLWSLSRHPNYVGEVMLWASQVMIGWSALPVWMRLMSCLSPVLEYLLITKASGVPLLEEKADKQFQDNLAYQTYKARTPVFWPKLSWSS